MRFCVVTPVRNGSDLIVDTALSLRNQSVFRDSENSLLYLLCDGASTDSTVDKVSEIFQDCPSNMKLVVRSQPDNGMYDALAKGLEQADGDVVSYINAGDYYSNHAFSVVKDVFDKFQYDWLTGCRVYYNAAGQFINSAVPSPFRKRLLDSGYYGARGSLGCIQQESTFWTSRANKTLDLDRLSKFRLAGDFYMWTEFARHFNMYTVASHLGGFRLHDDRASLDQEGYVNEMRTVIRNPKFTDRIASMFDTMITKFPLSLRFANSKSIVRWSEMNHQWIVTK